MAACMHEPGNVVMEADNGQWGVCVHAFLDGRVCGLGFGF